jgi:hypothetical protein
VIGSLVWQRDTQVVAEIADRRWMPKVKLSSASGAGEDS